MGTSKVKFFFLLGNLIPFVQLLIFVSCLVRISSAYQLITFLFFYIYLLPPLLFRSLNLFYKFESGTYRLNDQQLLVWWYGAQLQLLFSRFSFFEEFLRITPFLYSAWLRLWGAKIGKSVYWSPKVEILDRNLLEVGDHVVVGYGVKMTSHLFNKDKIFLAPIKIGANSVVGGDSRIAPGCVVEDGAIVHALTTMLPMSVLSNTEIENKKKNH